MGENVYRIKEDPDGQVVREAEEDDSLYGRALARHRARSECFYPEDDGEPLSESTLHLKWIIILFFGLKSMFEDREDVFIAGDLLWYPVEGEQEIRRAPDVMVAFGRPRREDENLGSYQQWQEDNIPPQVVFEVRSPSDYQSILDKKFEFYDAHGVEEYYLCDPKRNRLEGWSRKDGRLHPQALANWKSPRLGIGFEEKEGELIRILTPDGKPFLDPLVLKRRWQEELERERLAVGGQDTDELMESLEEKVATPPKLTSLWVREALRRDREIDEGLVTCKTAETVMQEIFEKISRKNA